MTPEEASQVLVSAREQAQLQRWDDINELLAPIDEAGLLTGTESGEASFLLGASALRLGSFDAAHQYFTAAVANGDAEVRAQAQSRLEQLAHGDAAHEAEDGGVTQAEAATVLVAADEAYARHDFETAAAHYGAVYEGQASGEEMHRAALGLGWVAASTGDLDGAERHAGFVEDGGDSAQKTAAAELRAWVAGQRGHQAAAADGTTQDEYAEAATAANHLTQAGDVAGGLAIYADLANNDSLPGSRRGRMAYNAGVCSAALSDETTARAWFAYAAAHADAETGADANRMLAVLDRADAAAAIVAADEIRP